MNTQNKNDLQQLNKNNCAIYESVSPETFVEKFNKAQKTQRFSECVSTHTIEECKHMKCLCSKNGFVAIEPDGNITAVLRDKDVKQSDNEKAYFLRDLMANAKANGGDKLDCFAIMHKDKDGNSHAGLADMYAQLGFVPVCRDKFNKDFAPDGWDYEEKGEPDIVFMYNNDTVEKMLEKSNENQYPSYVDYFNNNDIPYIQDIPGYDPNQSSYEQALAYRDQIMKEAKSQIGKAVQQSNTDNISKISENEFVDENTDDITKK